MKCVILTTLKILFWLFWYLPAAADWLFRYTWEHTPVSGRSAARGVPSRSRSLPTYRSTDSSTPEIGLTAAESARDDSPAEATWGRICGCTTVRICSLSSIRAQLSECGANLLKLRLTKIRTLKSSYFVDYSFADSDGMEGWVGLVHWPIGELVTIIKRLVGQYVHLR